jgi:hypothetical protein
MGRNSETKKNGEDMAQEKNNTGAINITFPPLGTISPTEKDGLLIVAKDLLRGVEVLSDVKDIPPRACALIAAHALECGLKAFLCHKGKGEKLRDRKVRHNIIELWDMVCKEKTLDIPDTPPVWVKILSDGHGPNYYFRYQEGQKDQNDMKVIVHGGQTPELASMAIELRELIEKVKKSFKEKKSQKLSEQEQQTK